MIRQGMTSLQKLVQQQLATQYQLDSSKESVHTATTTDSEGPAPRRGRLKQKEQERRHSRRPPSPSTSRSLSPPVQRKTTTSRRAHSRTNRGQDYSKEKKKNPTGCKHCTKYGGNGLAHGPPNNIPYSKCNYNKNWTGWRPEWVCKNIGVDFKEYDDCSE